MKTRDRATAAAVVVIVAVLAAGVMALVSTAERSGIETRQNLRSEQTRQLAGSMEARVQSTLASLGAVHGAPGTWEMQPGSPEDAARLAPTNPAATTGAVLVDDGGIVINGSLLRDPDTIGSRLTRPGLAAVLTGQPAILPVAEGLTTPGPTIAVAVPVRRRDGALAGAHLTEIEVAAGSAFNLEVAELRVDEGSFSFIDENDVVVASSDDSMLAERLDADEVADLAPGFHRRAGEVSGVAEVPSAGWRLVFEQSEEAFQGDLTTPLRRALLLMLATGAVLCAVAVVALLRRLAAAREEQRRLAEIAEAREEFTSIVSHELRTPVAGLLGFLQTTIDHWEVMPDPERRRAVTRAFANARSLQALTSDVLDSASIESQTLTYRFEPLDLRALVEDAVAAVRDAAPERPINVDVPDAPVWVRGDALRLGQVLTNLLDNAAKSSPPESAVDVMVDAGDREVVVAVRDRGPGIAADERERVFEKFTRGRSGVSRGTGLGLYITRHIVEAHDGRIWVEPDDHPGATIRFTVPAASAPPAA